MNRSVLSNRMQRVYLFGGKSCGKSSIIEQLIFGGQSSYTMRKVNSRTVTALTSSYVKWSPLQIMSLFFECDQDLGATIDDIYIGTSDRLGKRTISHDLIPLSLLVITQLTWTTTKEAESAFPFLILAHWASWKMQISWTGFAIMLPTQMPSFLCSQCWICTLFYFWIRSKERSIESAKRKTYVSII